MQEYSYTVKRQDKTAYLVVLFCFILAVVSWAVSQIENIPFPAAFQTVTLLCLCTALWTATRFLLRDYTYSLTRRDDGGFDFVVMERQGRRLTCQCRVGTETFHALLPWTSETKAQYRSLAGRNWCCEMAPKNACLLTLTDGDEQVGIKFTPDVTLTDLIRTALSQQNTGL